MLVIFQLMGSDRWNDCGSSSKWRSHGGSIRSDCGQCILHGHFCIASRVSLFNAFSRRRLLLVGCAKSQSWPRSRILYGISECVRLVVVCIVNKFHVGERSSRYVLAQSSQVKVAVLARFHRLPNRELDLLCHRLLWKPLHPSYKQDGPRSLHGWITGHCCGSGRDA